MTPEERVAIAELVVRIARIEQEAATAKLERAALRRLGERNENTLQEVLQAFQKLAESQQKASAAAQAALTIVQNALVLRPSEAPPETKDAASDPAAEPA